MYRVKESDGFAVIKLLVSGYRRSSLQVGAKAFVQTKFDLPAGYMHEVVVINYDISVFAADGKDFKIGYYYFNCPPHSNEAIIKIPVFNNNDEEETESFAVNLFKDKRIKHGDPFLAEVIIEDGQLFIIVNTHIHLKSTSVFICIIS